MKESKVSARQLVEAGEDPTVLLDLADEALHQAPFWVKMRIIRVWLSAPRAAVSREAPHLGADDGAVQGEALQVGASANVLMHPFPDTPFRPAGKAPIYAVPLAICGRQQPPLRTRPRHPEQRRNEPPALRFIAYVHVRPAA